MHVQILRHLRVYMSQEREKFLMAVLGLHWVMKLAVAACPAAYTRLAPWTTYSWEMPLTYPYTIGSTGWVHSQSCSRPYSATTNTNA
ncbi:hypothetical protein, partial [Xanthomonas oryzae]|uniref:hypothetical protein n=1 Tax=Xanthomonas oryzae TaxID=347 RepID=UPI001C4BCFA8